MSDLQSQQQDQLYMFEPPYVLQKICKGAASKYEIWWYWCTQVNRRWVAMPQDWDGTLDQLRAGDIEAGIVKREALRPVETQQEEKHDPIRRAGDLVGAGVAGVREVPEDSPAEPGDHSHGEDRRYERDDIF